MNPFRADLHCHSTCSDGSLTPVALLQLAAEIGLQGLSITDHDTIEAYATAIDAAPQHGIALIAGVEFSASLDGKSVHILGYAFALSHPAITALCARHAARREERNREILSNLAKMKLPLSIEEVHAYAHGGSIGRPHIAQAMVARGYVASLQEAFKRYIGEGRPAFAKGFPISVEETLNAIHQAKGLAIIAHPHLIDSPALLRQLLSMPFDGIECFYSKFPQESNAPWIEEAQKHGWLITGGSDFHGSVKPTIALGASWIGEEPFRLLQSQHLKNNPP